MDDFRLLIKYLISLFSIEIPVFGYTFSIFSIMLGFTILSIVIGGIIKIFGGR